MDIPDKRIEKEQGINDAEDIGDSDSQWLIFHNDFDY
jgi:hypothetical protein